MSTIIQTMAEKDVKVKQKLSLHRGFCNIEQYLLEQKRFDNSWSPPYTREFVLKPRAVGALPYDPKQDRVVLIEQFRVGALGQSTTPWLIEIVAGIMDKEDKESAEETIRREMHEEANLEIEALLPICDYFSSPGYSTERLKLFCAKVDSTKVAKFCGLKDEHEDIKIHVASTAEAIQAVRLGQINNAAAIIAIQWLELNLELVKKQWA